MLVIMCWFHVKEALQLRLSTGKNRLAILSDIEYLHIAANSVIFNSAVKLFLLKWQPIEPEFCEYFNDVWIKQHPNWYIGAADYIPCHNNALESSNRYLKENNTFRVRHPLPQFLKIATETVEKWSNNYVVGLKTFALKPTISLELWTNSYNWARLNVPTKIVASNEDTVIVEIEAEVVRAKKSSKRGDVMPQASSSNSFIPKAINKDVQQLFESENTVPKVGRKRRHVPTKACQSDSQPETKTSKKATSQLTTSKPQSGQKAKKATLKSQPEAKKTVSQSPSEIIATEELQVPEVLSTQAVVDFETYKSSFFKWTTTIVRDNVLYASRCNCPKFGTEYMCKHIVGLGIRLKLVTPPPEAKTLPIGQKRRRGRPSKNKPALMLQ